MAFGGAVAVLRPGRGLRKAVADDRQLAIEFQMFDASWGC